MEAKDFWKYKIFEPGMHKAVSGTATPCADAGYTQYDKTDTHGVPYVISMTLDMYKMPKEELEASIIAQLETFTRAEVEGMDTAAEQMSVMTD